MRVIYDGGKGDCGVHNDTSSVTVLTFLLNHPDNAHTTAALAALPARGREEKKRRKEKGKNEKKEGKKVKINTAMHMCVCGKGNDCA